jgi:crotonobetainyl-CoA:carnitine CoA-transferase CaiB-like acyl-CoA transferase
VHARTLEFYRQLGFADAVIAAGEKGAVGNVHLERRRTMTMPTWPVRFDSIPTAVKSAPLLGEHTAEVLADWLGLDAAAVAGLRQDGIV